MIIPITTKKIRKLGMENESQTSAELIDPMLRASGWGIVEDSKILREFPITAEKIKAGGGRGKREVADYIFVCSRKYELHN